MRNVSDTAIELLCEFEGFSATAYPDVANIWTIGYGTTRVNGQPVRPGMTCTKPQAKQWMHDDVKEFARVVNAVDASQRLTQSQFDACVVLAYNIGAGGFSNSSIARKIRANTITTINESNFTAWNKSRIDGKLIPVAGLTRRRRAEYYLFSTGGIKTHFD